MNNPRTTVVGYLAMTGGVALLGQKLWLGQPLTMDDLTAVMAFLTGMGLVAARDGGH